MILSVAGLDFSVTPFPFLVAVVISPSFSSLASSGLVVVVQMLFFSLLAGSIACLGSVSFLGSPFSDSSVERGSEDSSCVSMLKTELSASVSFLVCASRCPGLEPSFNYIVLLVVFRNATVSGSVTQ